jgi:hypothetical protein
VRTRIPPLSSLDRKRAIAFALLACAPVARGNHGPGTSGGGTTTSSGELLKKGQFELALRTDYTQFENVSRAEAEARALVSGEFDAIDRSVIETASISYGVCDSFQLGASFGYYWGSNFVDAESDGMGGAESATADPDGITDLWLSGKFRLMHGSAGHLAAIGAVKFPVGDDDEKLSNGEPLEPSSQPSSGAFDYQLGLAYSRYLSSRVTLDASAAYTLRTEHDEFQVGDRADAGIACAYRFTEDVRSFPNVSVSLELLGVWLDKDEDGGVANENSGGETLYVAPGARVRFDEHIAFAIAPAFPLAQDLNGDQVETEWKASAVLSATF